ncbi:hypothetical protein H4Q26_015109 [Puccinia striiformis f. sp. tritici PST-130]|nr:hypothetical protein H4Q26_015109 [Puccinia striiformis f. sp. tritici PST-130]
MISPVILAILCHSAYLNIFTVILNAPAGVVAPATILEVEGAGSLVHDARGGSFPDPQTRALGGGGEQRWTYKNVKTSDEETLLRLVRRQDEMVSKDKEWLNQYGYKGLVRSREGGYPFLSLETIASRETAFTELRSEGRWASDLHPNNGPWRRDPLYLKLKKLRQISLSGGINPSEAQLAINRLSILEYKEFKLRKADKELIENIAWERVVGRIVEEITMKRNDLEPMAYEHEDVWEILQALDNMQLIMSYDTARWSPETTRLLENIKAIKTDGDNTDLILEDHDRKTIVDLKEARRRINFEKRLEATGANQLS